MTIGEFSRRVGVTPSALRYYDDCGLLVPADVDPRTAYRFYAPAQQRRAVIIRLLRDAGVPLADVRRLLDAPDEAQRVIGDHEERIAVEADAATAALRSAMRLLTGPDAADTVVSVSGPQLASGLRQITPAVDRSGEHAVLSGVLVEIEPDEVRLVASDRFRLAVRTLPVRRFEGGAVRATVVSTSLQDLIPALLRADGVDLRAGPSGLTCRVDDHDHPLDGCEGRFPDYRAMLNGWVRRDARMVVDRAALLASLEPVPCDRSVRVGPVDDGTVGIATTGTGTIQTLPCAWTGRRFDTWFDVSHLAEALSASVGPDVIIDMADAALPAVVRSADHGSLTTLVMPRRRDAAGDGHEED